jgi:hypothetical protein
VSDFFACGSNRSDGGNLLYLLGLNSFGCFNVGIDATPFALPYIKYLLCSWVDEGIDVVA